MKYITDIDGAIKAVRALRSEPVVGLDIETTGLDPRKDRIRLIQIASPTETYLFDLYKIPLKADLYEPVTKGREFQLSQPLTYEEIFVPLLTGRSVKISHNAKFEANFIWNTMRVMPEPIFDTMLVDQVVRGGSHASGLKLLADVYLGESLDKEEQLSDWGAEQLTQKQLDYAARDASVLLSIKDRLDAEVSKHGLERIVELEHRFLPAMVWMESNGVGFDQDKWNGLAIKAREQMDALLERLNELVKEHLPQQDDLFGETVREVNWNSAAQIKTLLLDLGLDVKDTRHESLVAIRNDHPMVTALVDYREAAKKVNTYGDKWAEYLNPVDGRIYADWRQIGAATGRMACSKPNLQNLPRAPEYRECFRAAEGNMLIRADYEQIELRIAAEMAPDARMKQAFVAKKDLHETTASYLLGRDSISPEERQMAKAVNFGLLFGMGARALADYARTSYNVPLEEDEATTIRKKYFDTYEGIRNWHRAQGNVTETRTVMGRRRELIGDKYYTARLNTPVQGTGADGLKWALVNMWESRGEVNAFPIMTIHDEIVIEAEESRAEEAKDWLTDCMITGMEEVLKEVPVTVSAEVKDTL